MKFLCRIGFHYWVETGEVLKHELIKETSYANLYVDKNIIRCVECGKESLMYPFLLTKWELKENVL